MKAKEVFRAGEKQNGEEVTNFWIPVISTCILGKFFPMMPWDFSPAPLPVSPHSVAPPSPIHFINLVSLTLKSSSKLISTKRFLEITLNILKVYSIFHQDLAISWVSTVYCYKISVSKHFLIFKLILSSDTHTWAG